MILTTEAQPGDYLLVHYKMGEVDVRFYARVFARLEGIDGVSYLIHDDGGQFEILPKDIVRVWK